MSILQKMKKRPQSKYFWKNENWIHNTRIVYRKIYYLSNKEDPKG